MREVIALAVKDMRQLLEDKAGAFFALIFPLIVAIFFGAIFSTGSSDQTRAMRIALVDEDRTEQSAAFVADLDKAEEFVLERVPREEGGATRWELPTREEATAMVRRGKVAAYVVLPPGFGQARERVFWGPSATVEVGIDPSRKAEAAMLDGLLTRRLFARMQEMFSDRKALREHMAELRRNLQDEPGVGNEQDRALRQAALVLFARLDDFLGQLPKEEKGGQGATSEWQPLVIKSHDVYQKWEGPRNNFQVSFPQGMLWGMMATAAAFGMALVEERTRGTLVRLRMAPISRAQILGGKASACFASAVLVCGILLAVGVAFFGVRPTSYGLVALAVGCSAVAFVGMMMVLSALAKTQRAAGGIGWAVMMILTMLGGGSVPLFFMPPWLQKASYFSPMRWSVVALEGGIWRGLTLGEVALPCAILVGVGLVCFAFGVRAFRWMQES
jgi:ABC-2 type transport system permease protein